MLDITNLTTKTTLNAKIIEVKYEIPGITNLATKMLVMLLKVKYLVLVTQFTNLVTDYNAKINEIKNKITDHNHDKYITTPEFGKLISENFAARLKQANLASQSDVTNFVNKTDFGNKLLVF